ncbi:MAG: hypothetical protein FJ098_04190 [Deltaproteobacteria bacterium]|nr:hypothetical protein [Deltaproteobacteria bacterium]
MDLAGDLEAAAAGDSESGRDRAPLIGAFRVQLFEPVLDAGGRERIPGQTWVVGKVSDGPTPQPVIWDEVGREGACRLLVPRAPFCREPCMGGTLCVEEGTCQGDPGWVDVGPVHLSGVATTAGGTGFPLSLVGAFYQPGDGNTPAYPPFAEGDPVVLTADGRGDVPGFTLAAAGIAQLVVLGGDLVLKPGKGLRLKWVPPEDPELARVRMEIDISHHGGLRGLVTCDAADVGELEIPATLTDALVDLGTSGFPVVAIRREVVGVALIPAGRVELSVSSGVERAVEIPGLVSCLRDDDCPEGQICVADKTCW